jgi:transmembrane sensor
MKIDPSYNQQISNEASEWVILIDERPLTRSERNKFTSWIRLSPVHVSEFLLLNSILLNVEDAQNTLSEDISQLIPDNILEVSDYRPDNRFFDNTVEKSTNRFGHFWIKMGTAASIAVLLIVGLNVSQLLDVPNSGQVAIAPAAVSTKIGEDRVLRLPDGSVIHLNTDTKVNYVVNESHRRVELIAGEAFFDIAPDPTRPFFIRVDNTMVRVVGTAFNIRSLQGGANIDVSEGEVTASIISGTHQIDKNWMQVDTEVLSFGNNFRNLHQGDRAIIDTNNITFDVSQFEHKMIATWRHNELVFDNESIAEIVKEYNRYNDVQLKVSGSGLSERRLTGVFNSHDPESFLEYLSLTSDIIILRKDSEIMIEAVM